LAKPMMEYSHLDVILNWFLCRAILEENHQRYLEKRENG